jgi:Holliday junction resolvasome RuvABC DNA-binding subunit
VLYALVNLGYQRSAAEKAVAAALDEGGDISVELILRRSLRKLAKV